MHSLCVNVTHMSTEGSGEQTCQFAWPSKQSSLHAGKDKISL